MAAVGLAGTGATAIATLSRPTVQRAVVQVTPPPGPVPSTASSPAAPALAVDAPGTVAIGAGSPADSTGSYGPTEQLVVGVRPGPFVPPPSLVTVRMTKEPFGMGVSGPIDGLRVVDARGSLTGWQLFVAPLTCTVSTAGGARALRGLHVVPETPTVIDGDPIGLTTGHDRAGSGDGVVVLAAEAGHGGGTFLAHATLTAHFSSHTTAEATCTVAIRPSLGTP